MNRPAPSQVPLFISYSHADADSVADELELFRNSGLEVWYDDGIRGGHDWQEAIAGAIQGSAAFVCYISQTYLQSRHCLNELNYSIGCGKRLLPIYIDTVQLPPALQLSIGNIQGLLRYKLDAEKYQKRLIEDARGLVNVAFEPADQNAVLQVSAAQSATTSDEGISTLTNWATDFRKTQLPRIENVRATSQTTTLLVVPFRSLTSGDEQDFIAEGMTEDLTMFLARNPDMEVVSANVLSSLGDGNILTVAREQGAQYVFSGSVAVSGPQLNLRAKLIDSKTAVTVWSDQFKRKTEDIFEVQGEVIRSLANVIGPAIWHSEGQRIARQDPDDLRAWELTHRAIFEQFNGYSRATSLEAESLARRAVATDPNYALGVSTLAQILANRVMQCLSDNAEEDILEAMALSDRSMVLSPQDPRILTGSSVVNCAAGELMTAMRYSRKALEQDISVGAIGFLGLLLIMTGSAGEGVDLTKDEMRRDPHGNRHYLSLGNLGLGYMALGEIDQALESLNEALTLHPLSHMNWLQLALCENVVGNAEGARRAIEKVKSIEPTIPLERFQKAVSWQSEKYPERLKEIWNAT